MTKISDERLSEILVRIKADVFLTTQLVDEIQSIFTELQQLRAHNSDSAEPVAWRWRMMGDKTWTYDPAQWFIDKNRADPKMEFEPLYLASPPAKEVEITEEMVECAAKAIVLNHSSAWEHITDKGRDLWRKDAKDALQAALTNRTPDDEVGNG